MRVLHQEFFSLRSILWAFLLLSYLLWVFILVICLQDDEEINNNVKAASSSTIILFPRPLAYYAWSIGQWMIWISPALSSKLTEKAWKSFELQHKKEDILLQIPTISVQDYNGNSTAALQFLQTAYGQNWRERPLLLKGLWKTSSLLDPHRELSISGLLTMNLTIPYYTDARIYGALQPDDKAPVHDIIQRMLNGFPHKIGSQFIVQNYPSLLEEVAPLSFVKTLFGDYFSIHHLLGHGKTLGVFPGITTVPVFVANGNATTAIGICNATCESLTPQEPKQDACTTNYELTDVTSADQQQPQCQIIQTNAKQPTNRTSPSTGLHCEPIANVAVQLSGFRQWTLVDPQHSWHLKPAISKDGRSFYPSWLPDLEGIPRYQVITYPGDAVFVPTWTWHRVDYLKGSTTLSIGASLFHFRAWDFWRRNPLFAVLLLPALMGELIGISSQ